MDKRFAAMVESLAPKLEELLAKKPCRHGAVPFDLPERGVYLFSKGRKHLYVGRSNALRKRFHRHFNNPKGAAFAFLLARDATDRKQAVYAKGKGGTRAELLKDPTFKAAFDDAKRLMKDMDYRCVEESDPTRQALLEIYCATVLNTPHNSFENH